MPATPPEPPPRRARYGVVSWLGAGLVGVFCAAAVGLLVPLDRMHVATAMLGAVVVGGLAIVSLAPWRRVTAWRSDQLELRAMEARVRSITGADDSVGLSELVLDRNDEIGRLSRAVHDALRELAFNRRDALREERRRGQNISREARLETTRLRKAAFTDPLTGLGNRRDLDQRLQELTQLDPAPDTVVAMVADLDLFKQVNDTLGHEIGDGCLSYLGQLLGSSVRRGDSAIRLGGDEFVILMPGQSLHAARQVAQRLCRLFGQMPWPHVEVPPPGISIGLAHIAFDDLNDGRTLLRRADEALYEAKRTGRGRVVVWGEEATKRRSDVATKGVAPAGAHR